MLAKFQNQFFAIKNTVIACVLIRFETIHETIRELNQNITQAKDWKGKLSPAEWERLVFHLGLAPSRLAKLWQVIKKLKEEVLEKMFPADVEACCVPIKKIELESSRGFG